ncbi:MAG: nucleotide exchange factor GrpE [Planctomycetes bacterium]|nr:nucleotide exchange factor GrpE [Planctomycetota bacterium]
MVDPDARANEDELLDELASGRVEDADDERAETTSDAELGANEQPVTMEALQDQLDEANDRVLRAQAELENFRKRARRDMDEQRHYANLPLVSGLLPAIDNLGRAVEAAEQNENATGLLEGVKMVAVQIQSILEQHNCRRVAAIGSTFDPNVHEAIAQEPSEEVPAGDVTREVLVGYQLHDRVIRPAQVMVSTGAPQKPANEQ